MWQGTPMLMNQPVQRQTAEKVREAFVAVLGKEAASVAYLGTLLSGPEPIGRNKRGIPHQY